ncbi:hypothetical protein BC826DRAFT_520026 [Russula brevipes]|nr:hypothetical protein BC826DRAFT_520026 [Russula brevipes]
MFRRRPDVRGAIPVTHAPRINPCPLPDIKSPQVPPPIQFATSPPSATHRPSAAPRPSATHRPSTTHRPRHHGVIDEPGYSSSLETSATPRLRRTSQIARTPLVPTPPLKGILKTGGSESSVVFRASLIQQDRDGYTSSPEKATPFRPAQAPNNQLLKSKPLSKPPRIVHTTNADPSIPPATLHWKLLPFDPHRSKGKLKFDFAREVDEIVLGDARGGSRPLSVMERNKSAGEPGLTEMVIHCVEISDWPVYVARQSGIRCVDVFEAIRDTYDVVLTATERSVHQSRVRDFERRRPPTPEGAKKCVRRRDLLDGKTLFLGLDWKPSDSRFPKGCWCLKVGPL